MKSNDMCEQQRTFHSKCKKSNKTKTSSIILSKLISHKLFSFNNQPSFADLILKLI